MNRSKVAPALLVVLALALAGTASADVILFDFNTLAPSLNSVAGNQEAPNSDPIEAYMEALYGSDIYVEGGAATRQSRVESRPSGKYLGNTDGAEDRGACNGGCNSVHDTFLINRWNVNVPNNDRITITFLEEPIWGFEVDWEIFPVTVTGAPADLTIKADGVALAPFLPYSLVGTDKELGDLGHFAINFSSPVHTLEFIDWTDAPIGIDNLKVTRRVPEPGTVVLLLAGLGAMGLRRRRQ